MVRSTNYNCLRRSAQRRGLILMKRRETMDNRLGTGYQLINRYTGEIVQGRGYLMTKEQVRDYLNQISNEFIKKKGE